MDIHHYEPVTIDLPLIHHWFTIDFPMLQDTGTIDGAEEFLDLSWKPLDAIGDQLSWMKMPKFMAFCNDLGRRFRIHKWNSLIQYDSNKFLLSTVGHILNLGWLHTNFCRFMCISHLCCINSCFRCFVLLVVPSQKISPGLAITKTFIQICIPSGYLT